MKDHFDELEIRSLDEREAALFCALPVFLKEACQASPGLGRWLAGVDVEAVTSRAALASLPVLRKSRIMELQAEDPPFGGFVSSATLQGGRVFLSPGPIWEAQAPHGDRWQGARALFAAGARSGDVVHNAFSYHMTPGGFIFDSAARSLDCTVFAAGTGNTEMQVEAAAMLRPRIYTGTPDFLKILLDKAGETGKDLSSIRIGLVSGGALFPGLRAEYQAAGISVLQCYATAELGVIAYESAGADGTANPGMIVSENLIVEIVRPGTDDPVPDGEVGEVVVTSFNPAYPMVRLGTGDLSAVMPGTSPCGRTNMRIRGWMGRADQRTKIKGMFVDPLQIARVMKRHPELARVRLVVRRDGGQDAMTLLVEPLPGRSGDLAAIAASLREATGLGGTVELAPPDTLPNDGKVIADERVYDA